MKRGVTKPCKFCKEPIYRPPSAKTGHYFFHLKCLVAGAFNFPCATCGEAIYTQPAQLKHRARSTCSPACRSVLRQKQANERHQKYGYTKHQLDRIARYSKDAIAWRKAVFERDNYTCQMCRTRGGRLEADHIKPWAFFPELRFVLENGRTLCRPCHDSTKQSYKVMRKTYETRRAT